MTKIGLSCNDKTLACVFKTGLFMGTYVYKN